MTKKQIEKKAKEWCKQYIECDGNCRWCPNERYKDYFIEGADWALSHQWVSVEDELPPALQEDNTTSIRVIVRNEDNAVFVDAYNFQRKEWRMGKVSIFKVTHWMPIPPLAEEGGEK